MRKNVAIGKGVVMFDSWRIKREVITRCWLAASLLLVASTGVLAADHNQLAWAPSRDEAIVVDGFPGSMLSGDPALSKSLLAQRPRSLSRPAPMRSRTYLTDAPVAGEPLPSVSGQLISPDGLPVPGETYYDEDGGMIAGDAACCDAHCCQPNCSGMWGGYGGRFYIPVCFFIPRPPLNGLEFFGGVQGFTGPANRGGSGSFGFHEGFNWGVPIGGFLAGQFGANWVQSNFDGNYLTPDSRNQIFATGGLYRRVDWGFQGGLVVDYLHDGWDYTADLLQLRGELSWLWCGCNEIGFWFTAGVNDANNLNMRLPVFAGDGNSVRFVNGSATLAVNDLYAFYFRRQFVSGGQGRLFGGFTGHGQGLVGGDATLPLNPNWALRSNFIYVTPGGNDTTTDPRFVRESWNVGISLVWTPCPRSIGVPNYCRPLFNVADNGTFITRLLR
jgi:uncharacterized protein DUF6666